MGEAGRTCKIPTLLQTSTRLTCLSQLFLEEERERDLEQLYESGLADTLNREDLPIGSGDPTFDVPAQAETANVSKQTTETLMAGERISEALELADEEVEAYRAYERSKEGLSEEQLAAIQPPPRNPLLAAQNLEPEAWVLRVVEGVQSAALHDALLVLPFNKVVSLMVYLNIWAQRVSTFL
jgi:U3 small nucleolar RNA-associated protein 12